MIDYTKFPGLAGVYLEDSYVLNIFETPAQLAFELDAVLTPDSPAYHPPRQGEQYYYENGRVVFPEATQIEWLRRSDRRFTDAAGDSDLGNIDILDLDGDAFVVEGDWGRVRIVAAQPRFELDN
jgi:hypothetical protein